jgi:hypothetical protein
VTASKIMELLTGKGEGAASSAISVQVAAALALADRREGPEKANK